MEVVYPTGGAGASSTADAGATQTVNSTSLVTLDGSNSSASSYTWTLTRWTPAGVSSDASGLLSDDTAESPTFTPEGRGYTYEATLTVDGGASDSTVVLVTRDDALQLVDLSEAVVVDNNSVIASGSFASGSISTNGVASDTRSTSGDPARAVVSITEDLTDVVGITIFLTGVSFTNATNTGLTVQVVDDDDPSVGKGLAWHWTSTSSAYRVGAGNAFLNIGVADQGIASPETLIGAGRMFIDSTGQRMSNPWAQFQDADDESGNGNRSTGTGIVTLSGSAGFKIVLAIQQGASANAYSFDELYYQLHRNAA